MVIGGRILKWLIVNVIVCGLCVESLIVSGYPPMVMLRSNDICSGTSNGRRAYLELGDSGVLLASNVTTRNGVPIKSGNAGSDLQKQNTTQFQCSLELVTCSSCTIKVTLRFLNFSTTEQCTGISAPNKISSNPNVVNNKSYCNCDYLSFSEPPFDAVISGHRYCGAQQPLHIISQTRSLSIKYLYRANRSGDVFKLDYISQRNVETISGFSTKVPQQPQSDYGHHNVVQSPFFPALYPRDITKEHLIICNDPKVNRTRNPCRIRVIFTDFQVALASTMAFFDWNGKQIDVCSGAVFRPPVIITTGPSLLIRFHANGGIGLGYRADIDFMTDLQVKNASVSRPFTDCGGYVESLGGAITMMNMVDNDTEPRRYDCIWLIRPSSHYLHLKTHLSLRLGVFNQFAGQSELVIRQGQTSRNQDVNRIEWNDSKSTAELKDYIVPMVAGFYVTFKGIFGAESRLALVYTAFSYMDCYIGSDFMCKNHKCIPGQLQCDGFDHCGDNSDEPDSCKDEWEREPFDRRWYSHTPNYYFPKMDRYPDLKTATIVFFISSFGLIFLISALVVLLYKLATRARHQRELQNHLQTISELLDNTVRIEEHGSEEPPAYDPPPDYEEVIKVGMDDDIHQKEMSNQRSGRRPSRFSHSRSRGASHSYQNAILEVIMPPETPTSSILLPANDSTCPSPLPINSQSMNLILNPFADTLVETRLLENATSAPSTSATGISTGSQTNSYIPESPPPMYRQQSNSSITIVIEGISSENTNSTTTPDRSSSYFNGFAEDLMDISFSQPTTPASSASNLLQDIAPQSPQIKHLWNKSSRIQKTWLTFRNDEPIAVQTTGIVNPMFNDIKVDSIPPESGGDVLSVVLQPIDTTLLMDQSARQLPFGSSKSLDKRVDLDARCVECGGTKKSLCLKECLRSSSVDTQMCRCDSPTLINFNESSRRSSVSHHVSTLRRSSSAEHFPLLMKETTAGWRK